MDLFFEVKMRWLHLLLEVSQSSQMRTTHWLDEDVVDLKRLRIVQNQKNLCLQFEYEV